MGSLTDAELDGVSMGQKYPDGTVVRVFCLRTDQDTYRSGWAYKLHYGATEPDPPRTLNDGTIRRYDNSHADTKGHELHVAPNPNRRPSSSPGWSTSGIGSGATFRNPNSNSTDHRQEIPMTETPPLHPMEREQLRTESTLVVTVTTAEAFSDDVSDAIETLETGGSADATPTLSFTSYDDLLETLTPRVLDLIEAIRREKPTSINEAARVVDRDVKNVYEELSRLAQLGIIFFEAEGQSKRPVVWFDELVISLPFDSESGDTATVAP